VGKSFFELSKRVMHDHITGVCEKMYKDAGRTIEKFLLAQVTELQDDLKKNFKKHLDKIQISFATMLKIAHKKPIADSGLYKAEFQKDVLVKLAEFDALLRGCSSRSDAAVGSEDGLDGAYMGEEGLECGSHGYDNRNYYENKMDDDLVKLESFSDEE
jgi:hypothetical protein